MRTLRLITGLVVLAAAASTLAKADDVVTFAVQGTGIGFQYAPDPSQCSFDPTLCDLGPTLLSPPPQPTVSGSFTYDFTTDTVLSNTVSLTDGYFDASSYFNPTPSGSCVGDSYCSYNLAPDGGNFSIFLTGYFYTPFGLFNEQGTYEGSMVPETASSVTPEPSSFALLGTGLLGIAGTLRRRYRGSPLN